MINVHFWRGLERPTGLGVGRAIIRHPKKKEWNERGQSFVVLAAIQWKILMEAMEKAKNTVSSE